MPVLPGQVLAASQSPVQKKWFQGTADAVRQYLWLFENSMREGVEDFLILAGAPITPIGGPRDTDPTQPLVGGWMVSLHPGSPCAALFCAAAMHAQASLPSAILRSSCAVLRRMLLDWVSSRFYVADSCRPQVEGPSP